MDEFEASAVVKQILQAVGYLLEQQVRDWDLRAETVILSSLGKATLVDYALGEHALGSAPPAWRSKNYLPPECLTGEEEARVGAWQVGVIAFLLLTGRFPHSGETT